MLACTCARQWNMDMCTPYYESLFMCWGIGWWIRRSTGLRVGWRNPPPAATPRQTACWPPASAPELWSRPQARVPSPGSGTKISSSWLDTETRSEWKSTAREFGAPVKNRRRTNADMLLWVVGKGKEEQMRTPTEHRGTPWTPEGRHCLLLLTHTHTQTRIHTTKVRLIACTMLSFCSEHKL